MGDPLSVAASIVGITVPALHAARLLFDDIQNVIDAPKVLSDLKDELESVQLALESVKSVEASDWESLGVTVVRQSENAIENCSRACTNFKVKLAGWTRHSEHGKLTFIDRTNIGFFKMYRIKSMESQLQSCKLSVNSVISIATLHSSLQNVKLTEQIKKLVSSKESEIKDAITVTQNRVQELANVEIESDGHEKDDGDAYEILKEESAALEASRELLNELLRTTKDEMATAVRNRGAVSVKFGDYNEGFQLGVNEGTISGFSFGGRGDHTRHPGDRDSAR